MDARFREIQQIMLDKKAEASQLNALDVLTDSEITASGATSSSKVANWRLFIWIFSFSLWLHEKVVSSNAAKTRPQNIPNYQSMVMSYIDGCPIIWANNQFQFDTTGLTSAEVASRMIIKRCAVLTTSRGILVKIATESGATTAPVTNDQAIAILYYINKNTQPGVNVTLINKAPDQIKLTIDVYIDPLIIEISTGKLKNTTEEIYPVKDAIKEYLRNLEFNGALSKSKLEDYIQKAAGVVDFQTLLLQWKYESLPFMDLGIYKIANSGHFEILDADLTINYKSNGTLG
ncbi:hypothetical protein [Flavobacterium sp. N1994]|uniref:hypothetical protein n=1 Tax=Flavobacterium sp. N1994 TaxID=2986827 RepID=UPI002221E1AE|nr:hypothetical protein [Flavobacterium sp. N1994]